MVHVIDEDMTMHQLKSNIADVERKKIKNERPSVLTNGVASWDNITQNFVVPEFIQDEQTLNPKDRARSCLTSNAKANPILESIA